MTKFVGVNRDNVTTIRKKIIFYHNALDESSYAAITRKGDHPSYSLTFINLISHPHKFNNVVLILNITTFGYICY